MYGLPEALCKTSASLVLGHRGTYNLLGDVLDFVERLGWEIIPKSTFTRCDARELKVRLVQLKEKRKAFSCPDRQSATNSERGVLLLGL